MTDFISVGTVANDGSGDTLRAAGIKINALFDASGRFGAAKRFRTGGGTITAMAANSWTTVIGMASLVGTAFLFHGNSATAGFGGVAIVLNLTGGTYVAVSLASGAGAPSTNFEWQISAGNLQARSTTGPANVTWGYVALE